MILKVTDRDSNALVRAVYFDARRADIATGVYWFDEEPETRKYAEICDAFYVHVIAIEAAADKSSDNNPSQWRVKFAYWYDGDEGRVHMVVTSGEIYLMSDRGDTVDHI